MAESGRACLLAIWNWLRPKSRIPNGPLERGDWPELDEIVARHCGFSDEAAAVYRAVPDILRLTR